LLRCGRLWPLAEVLASRNKVIVGDQDHVSPPLHLKSDEGSLSRKDILRAVLRCRFKWRIRIVVLILAFAYNSAHYAGIDDYFRQYAVKLPEPTAIGDMNGISLKCARGGATYAFLNTLAARVPLDEDEELRQAIPWLKHEDPCIRQIAVTAVARKIGFDTNRLAVPGMHDPEHHYYHQIILALRSYLDERHVPYDPKAFEGMLVDVDDERFSSYLVGNWEQADKKGWNLLDSVEVKDGIFYLSRRKVRPHPNWYDHTNTSKIKDVRTNMQRQYVISCEWSQESLANGFVSNKIVPSHVSYMVWPVTNHVMWLKEGDGSWKKFRRVSNLPAPSN
jgi:hypothetical protein